jgi:DNA polymerase III epsilon subunit-like protein
MRTYNVKNVFAHNASFDVSALNNTIRYLTKSKFRFFFPFHTCVWDTLKMARQTIGKQRNYQRFCAENDYMTKHRKPQVRLTAEILYQYISGDHSFSESHRGLEDVIIETKIMAHCFRQHKKMVKELYPSK